MSTEKEIQKEYTNGEITVVWKPETCIHSTICWHGLIEVFDPRNKPWVDMEGAPTEDIIQQVDKCPSGALSYHYNDPSRRNMTEPSEKLPNVQIEVIENGPLRITGDISVHFMDGTLQQKTPRASFCRCGASGNKPFCDGSHRKIGFNG